MVEPESKQERPRPQLTPEQQAIREASIQMADGLGETEPAPRAQVWRVVRVLGIERAQALYDRTVEGEAAGGMMLPDGSRRRTPGGVFFKLAREGATKQERRRIFPFQPKHGAPSPQSAAPGIALIVDIPNTTGEARTVKITLVGRPGRIVAKQGYVITGMTARAVPALPKGMPTPPATPTTYTVYISAKQWAKVAQALGNPEDILIVEGTPVYDPTLEGIAVYVTNATTKQLQQAQRAAQAGQDT